jgi:predicted regulator of Ras-like GTPase activity (Roadblock/LC7/MglB family)
MAKISNILDQVVKESDDLLGVGVFDYTSGILITEKNVDPEIDLAIPAAYFSELIKHTKTGYKEIGIGENVKEYVVVVNNCYIIIKSIKDTKYHMLCYISLNGNQSFIKEVLKKYEDPLGKELEAI